MAANFRILTNNPAVKEAFPGVTELYDATVEGIFKLGRDAIHFGARLINHPLSGSVKPNESPYKSLVLSIKPAPLHADSLSHIEGALQVLAKLGIKNREYPERALEDFRLIDLDLIQSAIQALPCEYHF
ncbi:MAG: GrdX family protein [Bacillota bacterium]